MRSTPRPAGRTKRRAVFVISAASAFLAGCLTFSCIDWTSSTFQSLPKSMLGLSTAFGEELRERQHALKVKEAMDGFDLATYRLFNPDVFRVLDHVAGMFGDASASARLHFLHTGKEEGRIGKHIPMFVNYTAPYGLANQIYSHLNALAIAISFKATLIVADAWSRNSFEAVHVIGTQWEQAPVETLLDLAAMQQYWSRLGIELTQNPDTAGCLEIDVTTGNGDPFRITDGPQHVSLFEAVSFIASNISQNIQSTLQTNPSQITCINVFIGRPIVLLNHRRSYPVGAAVAHGMFFAPEVVEAAEAILQAIGDPRFLGAHLRLEDDWRALLKVDPMGTYLALMKAAGYNAKSTVYVASGILGYANHSDYGDLPQLLIDKGVAGRIVYKETTLGLDRLKGFHSEQKGLIDMLVMTQAMKVVSDHRSSFGVFIREYRAVHGFPRSTFFAVGGEGGISSAWAFGQ